jgi:hypothetical protein
MSTKDRKRPDVGRRFRQVRGRQVGADVSAAAKSRVELLASTRQPCQNISLRLDDLRLEIQHRQRRLSVLHARMLGNVPRSTTRYLPVVDQGIRPIAGG